MAYSLFVVISKNNNKKVSIDQDYQLLNLGKQEVNRYLQIILDTIMWMLRRLQSRMIINVDNISLSE